MKKFYLMLCLCMAIAGTYAQSKIFKEVSDEISSQIKPIYQDESLVGYLVFTKLEKATADSFNYKITIMDENLNDIGKVNFRHVGLDLQAVSFEQDVICLGYFSKASKQTNTNNSNKRKNEKESTASKPQDGVILQLLNLEGKILKTNFFPVTVEESTSVWANNYSNGQLKHDIRLKNLHQKGFACTYGDKSVNMLRVFRLDGTQLFKKTLDSEFKYFYTLTGNDNIYILSKVKNEDNPQGGYVLQGYRMSDSSALEKFALKDKKGNSLKVLDFDYDPVSGKPYIAGYIINEDRKKKFDKVQHIAKAYSGVFTINLDGPKKTDIKEVYSYWGDGSVEPMISAKGYYSDLKGYAYYTQTQRDFQGNTYFIGSSYIKRPRIGAYIASTILAPTIMFPIIILGIPGPNKMKVKDVVILKQDVKGTMTVDNTVKANNGDFVVSAVPISFLTNRTFYTANNSDTKTNFVIIDDPKQIFIYNLKTKKTVRTIPHRDGKITTYVYPAKEGYIMVAEFNKKEKYSKFSIEAL